MQNAVRSSMSVLTVLTSDRSFHRVKIEDALKVVTCMQLSHAILNACVFACLCVCVYVGGHCESNVSRRVLMAASNYSQWRLLMRLGEAGGCGALSTLSAAHRGTDGVQDVEARNSGTNGENSCVKLWSHTHRVYNRRPYGPQDVLPLFHTNALHVRPFTSGLLRLVQHAMAKCVIFPVFRF